MKRDTSGYWIAFDSETLCWGGGDNPDEACRDYWEVRTETRERLEQDASYLGKQLRKRLVALQKGWQGPCEERAI